jgi:hypothetical protein
VQNLQLERKQLEKADLDQLNELTLQEKLFQLLPQYENQNIPGLTEEFATFS